MCKNHNPRKIDKCMRVLIRNLNEYLKEDFVILSCCCGHGKYPKTIIVKDNTIGQGSEIKDMDI